MRRRRFIAIAAAAGALAASPARAFRLDPVEWRGVALGAAASLTIHHEDRSRAEALLDDCRSEVERLERIFSLYRDDSQLVQLNRWGRLEAPSLDLVVLLGLADRAWRLSDGAFDPTVQPLWALHARHFIQPKADPKGPAKAEIERARELVGWSGVALSAERIVLGKPGMALTLNGIAQGYITDRIAELLRREGMRHVLVNMGEIAAIGPRGDGTGWRVELPDGTRITMADGALAVSSADGTRFSPSCHHIFDPFTGTSARCPRPIVAQAESAAEADAMSTAVAASGGRLGIADIRPR